MPQPSFDLLTQRFGDKITAIVANDKHPRIHTTAAHWLEIAAFLHGDDAFQLDWMRCLSGVDYAADNQMAVVCDLTSFHLRHDLAVKIYLPRDNPVLPSVAHLWRTADWHERETWDLLGIVFEGHPDPRRILLADDWVGHPLRKDYLFPREYHGIPGSVELDWKQH